MSGKFDLFKIKSLKTAFQARPFQFITQVPMVLVFLLVIVAGLLGTQIPGKNFATVLTWTIWWAGIIFLILVAGASWCLFCPWMALGNWVQRLAFWKKNETGSGLDKAYDFPKNRYPAIVFFFIISALELGILITYSPMYTALLALAMFFLAVVTALIWEKNTFCRYICFVGAIVGIYSNLSPVEVRRRDQDVCEKCKSKDCIKGNSRGYGCPIYEYPGGMEMNTNCTLCAECFKTCPFDNMTINVRPFMSDVSRAFKGRMDEAVLCLVLLGLTIFHGVTMMPEWFFWANESLKGNYSAYLFSFTLAQTAFALVPLLAHALLSYFSLILTGVKGSDFKAVFIRFAYSFLPVAISFHLAHNLAHIRKEGHKFFDVISDPFGWGWNLFETAKAEAFSVTHQMDSMDKMEDTEDHSSHDMSGHDMEGHSMEGDAMATHDMSTHDMSGHDMGHDMSSMTGEHEMTTQAGMMLHQPEFSYVNLVLILLGLLGGFFLVFRASGNTYTTGKWKGMIPFFIGIAAYSFFSWYLLNQPMVMRTE